MKMILNGKMIDSVSGQVFEVRNPATQEVLDRVPKGKRFNDDIKGVDKCPECNDESEIG